MKAEHRKLNDEIERLSESFSSLRPKKSISKASAQFIWAVAVMLIVIFVAFYLNARENNEMVLRTRLMRCSTQVAANLELHLRNITASIAVLIERLEQEGNNPAVFSKYTIQILDEQPELTLIRMIEPNGRGIQTAINPILVNSDLRQYNYLDYPQVVRDAIADAFLSNRVSISSFWFTAGDSTSPSIVIIYPFTLKEKSYAFMSRISLNKLLEESIPPSLKGDFEFSLLHGTEAIAGQAPYSPPDDYSLPSYIRDANPLPPSIQLYACDVEQNSAFFANTMHFWLGGSLLLLLISLFFLNREMRSNQNKLEKALKELEIRRSLENSISFAILITDINNKIIYINNAFKKLTGYAEDELVDKAPPYPFWGDSSPLPSVLLKDISRVKPDAFPHRFDLTIRHKDDDNIQCIIWLTPYYSSYNDHVGWIYVMRDNTMEAQSMDLTNDAIASYQRLLNSVLSAISVVSHKPSGSLLGIHNDKYTEQLGNTVDGHLAISKSFKEPYDVHGIREEEFYVDDLDRWFHVNEARVTLPGGSHVTLQVALDITGRKISEQKLEEQNNRMENSSRLITLGEMASTITHEINQPLTAVTAYASTAIEILEQARDVNKNQLLEVFQKIAKQADRINRIITNIRSFAKKRQTSLECISLKDVLQDAMELTKLVEKKYRGVKVLYRLPPQLPLVECDPVQINQILMNLVRNSAEALIENNCSDKNITVSVEIQGDFAKISVADHGPGISETMKASLFTPFFSTKKNGLGLGLSTCQTIAEAHNTKLRVTDNVNGGAIFSFELRIGCNTKDTNP